MSYTKLLVFSTVYLILLASANSALDKSPAKSVKLTEPTTSNGFCYEIVAGTTKIGSVLQIKSFKDGIYRQTDFTQLEPSDSFLQIAESDEHYTPLKSIFESYKNQKLIASKTSTFETVKNKIQIQTYDSKSKKPIKLEAEKGLVFSSQMTDLLFSKKNATQIKPNEKMIFQVYSESLGKVQQTQSVLETDSDHLILNHLSEGESFSTKHSSNGDLLGSHLKTKNIILKPCTDSSVLTYLNSALNHKKFKSLFSFDDREKIKKCCQHF